jgi:putative membrane protein
MYHETYQALGMHIFWWIFWIVMAVWIFATPYEIPGQRTKKGSPLDILKKRYAAGQINQEEYFETKKILESC